MSDIRPDVDANYSARNIPDKRLLTPKRRPVPPSDPFGKAGGVRYVTDTDGPVTRHRGASGRYLRPRGPESTGMPATTDELLAHRRDRKEPSEGTDWSRSAFRADHWAQAHGGLYPAPVFDGSNATRGMRCSDAEHHGRVVPDWARVDYEPSGAEDFDADQGMV